MQKKLLIIFIVLVGWFIAGCDLIPVNPDSPVGTAVVVDQTLSTRELRRNGSIERLLRALKGRPELRTQIFGMMPDRISPVSIEEAITKSYGLDDSGNFTGGDLQRVISYFENEPIQRILVITDGENNFGNIPTTIPRFEEPGKFYLVGIRPELWQQYHDVGVNVYTLTQVDDLLVSIVTTGKL